MVGDVHRHSVITSVSSVSSNASGPGGRPHLGTGSREGLAVDVPFSDLTFHEMIGKGSFKAVFRGRWNNTAVAIVRMTQGGLLTEARIMQQLGNHPNLVQFFRQAILSLCCLLYGGVYHPMVAYPLPKLLAVLSSHLPHFRHAFSSRG